MTGSVWRGVATAFQYIVPPAFVLGAIGSVIGGAKRRRLLEDVAPASQPGETMDCISWRQFEQLVGEAFRRQGFTVPETGDNGPDGGIDLILHKGGEKHLVQWTQWEAIKVGVAVIRDVFGVIVAEGASGGFVVTSGTYTKDAEVFARGKGIRLVSGVELKHWVAASRATAFDTANYSNKSPAAENAAPLCSLCRSVMVRRTASHGKSEGQSFWGCSKYPVCRSVSYFSSEDVS